MIGQTALSKQLLFGQRNNKVQLMINNCTTSDNNKSNNDK